MGENGIEYRAGHLWVDCRGAGARQLSERSRAFAVECIEKNVNRVLIDATDCDPDGHSALRDAFTMLILAGMPRGFRLAVVTNVARMQACFRDLQRDLQVLQIPTRLFGRQADAIEWLCTPAAPAAAAQNRLSQQA